MPTADQYRKALERLASPDEMAGVGELEGMRGVASVEMWHRIRYAEAALTDAFYELPSPTKTRVEVRVGWDLYDEVRRSSHDSTGGSDV